MKQKGLLLLALLPILWIGKTQAATVWDPFEPIDPTKMVLESDVALDGNPDLRFKTYIHPLGAPGSNKYNRPDATTAFKTAFILPTNPPGDASLKIVTYFDGYTADPGGAGMPDWYYGAPGFISIKTHPGHYPKISDYTVNGIEPFDIGAFAKGDSNSWRYGVGYAKIKELMGSSVDWNAGFRLEGVSWGGFTAILQSFLLKDPWAQGLVTIVNVALPGTLVVRRDTNPNDGIDKNGYYYLNTPAVQAAWTRPNDVLNADILTHAYLIKGKYYSVHGNSKDTGVGYDIDFFKLLCEDQKIACLGTWRNGDHGDTDPGLIERPDTSSSVGLPGFRDAAAGHREVFSGPDSDVRLDRILPVFTHSTANHWNPVRGHYNLGLEWNSDTGNVKTTTTLALPIRYRRHTGFGTGSVYINGVPGPDTNRANWIPDQPTSATFDLTLRRTGSFGLPLGKVVNFSLPAHGAQPMQTGTAKVTDADEITISGLTLENGAAYKTLTLTAAPIAIID